MQRNIFRERDQISIIVFEVGWEQFAIELLDIKEIIQSGHVRKLPQSMDYIDGIYNYRGDIIHIINLHKKLNLDQYRLYHSKEELYDAGTAEEGSGKGPNDALNNNGGAKKNYIIIVTIDNNNIGFYADKIHNVSQINVEDIVDLRPIFQTSVDAEYIKGVIKFKDRPRILIDLTKILTEEEQSKIIKNE
ncbi:MAG: Chemotaxis protein CheW [Promethearchaeota archaeon]|nr:MAG: Chemotaxis protein CheW [Candidatus Lokiarchaeota archaeon]